MPNLANLLTILLNGVESNLISSVKQFLCGSRNNDLNVVVYLRYGKHVNKRN